MDDRLKTKRKVWRPFRGLEIEVDVQKTDESEPRSLEPGANAAVVHPLRALLFVPLGALIATRFVGGGGTWWWALVALAVGCLGYYWVLRRRDRERAPMTSGEQRELLEELQQSPRANPRGGDIYMGREWRWPVFGLIALGWALWVVGVVFLVVCKGLQSNPGLASPKDPCVGLGWAVLGGFVFLLVTSVVALNYSSNHRRWR